jgi:hypothetical protein
MPIYPADNVYEEEDLTAAPADAPADPGSERIESLLCLAEAADACGRDTYAQYLRFHAERRALENGSLSLIARVWGWAPANPLS